MIKVRSFYLPQRSYDLIAALSAIPSLLQQLKELVCEQVAKARESIVVSSENQQVNWTRSPLVTP
jgi:hypothetical protein